MTRNDMLSWAETYHYPLLMLSRDPQQVLPAGSLAWRTFLLNADDVQLSLLQERIAYWEQTYAPLLRQPYSRLHGGKVKGLTIC